MPTICEHCAAEIAGTAERLPAPWFEHDRRLVAGEPVTPREWRILEVLYRRRGRAVARESLMALLYDGELGEPRDDKNIDVQVCRLRAKLDKTPYAIRTLWGYGYEFLVSKPAETTEVCVGEIERAVPLPKLQRPMVDKYGFRAMKVGESRRCENVKLATVRHACYHAQKRGLGKFIAGADKDGRLRIWRIE
jgi:hypothetical protein